jgi:hypothetical protein
MDSPGVSPGMLLPAWVDASGDAMNSVADSAGGIRAEARFFFKEGWLTWTGGWTARLRTGALSGAWVTAGSGLISSVRVMKVRGLGAGESGGPHARGAA